MLATPSAKKTALLPWMLLSMATACPAGQTYGSGHPAAHEPPVAKIARRGQTSNLHQYHIQWLAELAQLVETIEEEVPQLVASDELEELSHLDAKHAESPRPPQLVVATAQEGLGEMAEWMELLHWQI